MNITANDLKTRGVSIVEDALQTDGEAVITVRGKPKYAVIDLMQYAKLREYELEIAILEAKEDIAKSRVRNESVAEHMERVTD